MRRAVTMISGVVLGMTMVAFGMRGTAMADQSDGGAEPEIDRDSREVLDRCDYENSMARAMRKNVVAYPRPDVREKLAQTEAKLSVCQDGAVATIKQERAQAAVKAAAEKERLAAAAIEAERYQRIIADPKAQHVAFSALLCAWTDDEKEALHQVAEYRKASKIGGVLNLTEVNNWQEEVVRARQHMTMAKIELTRRKAKPLPCTHPWVARVAPCMNDEAHAVNECGPDGRTYVDIARGNE